MSLDGLIVNQWRYTYVSSKEKQNHWTLFCPDLVLKCSRTHLYHGHVFIPPLQLSMQIAMLWQSSLSDLKKNGLGFMCNESIFLKTQPMKAIAAIPVKRLGVKTPFFLQFAFDFSFWRFIEIYFFSICFLSSRIQSSLSSVKYFISGILMNFVMALLLTSSCVFANVSSENAFPMEDK